MHVYAFILGRKHLLSVAELTRALPDDANIIDITGDSLIATLEKPFSDPQKSLNRLGGTIKIVKIFNEDIYSPVQISEETGAFLAEKFAGHDTKFPYALSLYGFSMKTGQILRKSLNTVKKTLVAAGLKSRFINKNFRNPESAAIKGEKLLVKGAEIVAVKGSRKIFLGHTVALQDFEDYGRRDFSRPERDPRLGMLPPKLCQIMINLCGISGLEAPATPLTLYDPFCGIGTVLAEARLMGFEALGSDIEGQVIQKCQTNMEWITKVYPKAQTGYRLFTKDATSLNKNDLPSPADLIVTESYLGPPLSRMPLPENMRKTFSNITGIVCGFFSAIRPLIREGTPLAICLPFYRDRHRFHFIPGVVEKIAQNGFTVEEPIPPAVTEKFGLHGTPRKSLLYDRPDQVVGREVFIFRKD